MKLIDQIVAVFQENRGPLHVNDVALAILTKYPDSGLTVEGLAKRVSAALAADVRRRGSESLFAKPKNKVGGLRKGLYRLKVGRRTVSRAFKVPEQPKVTSQFTGKAGEFAVMSELLFFGFNASVMTVDDGIDVVASKGDSYFHIQVKTSNASAQGKFQFRVTKKAFGSKDAASTFYVLVLRVSDSSGNSCEYVVLPSSELRRLVDRAVVRDGEALSISIERERGSRILLNGVEDVSWALNRFDNIK